MNQLYNDQQPTKRGALILRQVDPNSAAADAGIEAGDLILATDGKRVFNTEVNEPIKRVAGPGGECAIELSIVQADGNLKKITLIRIRHISIRKRIFSATPFLAIGSIAKSSSRFESSISGLTTDGVYAFTVAHA